MQVLKGALQLRLSSLSSSSSSSLSSSSVSSSSVAALKRFFYSNAESGGVEEFFEEGRGPDPNKAGSCGRSWRAEELRLKSWDDLHRLWYVLYKEKNMLYSQSLMLKTRNMRMPNIERLRKVKVSMCRIKCVLTERASLEPDRIKRSILKLLINGK